MPQTSAQTTETSSVEPLAATNATSPGPPPPHPDIRDHLFLVQGPGLLAWASTVGEHTQERQDSGELAAMGRDRGQGQQKISSPSVGTSDAGPSPD